MCQTFRAQKYLVEEFPAAEYVYSYGIIELP